jgi:hypothetical protein
VGPQDAGDPVARARALAGTDEAAELYREWAGTYDDDVFGRLGFTGSARIAELAPLAPDVLHRAVEPVRRDGPPEAVMYVARTPV